MAEAKISNLARTFGAPVPNADPGAVIMERISVTAGHVRWLQARVESLTPDELVWNRTRVKVGGQDGGTTAEAKPSVWVDLYERWDRDLQRLCLEALRIGLKEREVRMAEAMGATICAMIDGVLADLGHDANDPTTAAIVARHLRLVAQEQESIRGQLGQASEDDDGCDADDDGQHPNYRHEPFTGEDHS